MSEDRNKKVRKEVNAQHYVIKNVKALSEAEEKFRGTNEDSCEQIAVASGTLSERSSYAELAETVIKDKMGHWATPLHLFVSRHKTIIGAKELCRKAQEFINDQQRKGKLVCDTLSIQADMGERHLILKILLRIYDGAFDIAKFFDFTGDELTTVIGEKAPAEGQLIIPKEIADFSYSDEEVKQHDKVLAREKQAFENSSKDKPFLNQLDSYEPIVLPSPYDHAELIYDLRTRDMQTKTVSKYDDFYHIFAVTMKWVTGIEKYQYEQSLVNKKHAEEFMALIKDHVKTKYVETGLLPPEDFPAIIDKLYRALYQLYIVQDLIDDPNITDINITAPDVIRVRIKGKTYLSNVHFVDEADYQRFINMIAVRNSIDLRKPEQTFTDKGDKNFILRFSITAAYVNSVDWAYLHIRKISRHKLLGPELKAAGMFDDKIEQYLLDCGKHSRGVVIAGPPGCVDSKTEFFNGRGWKSIAEWDNEPVLQFDTKTNEASLVMPMRYIKEPCDKMYHFETKYGIDQTLSPEHRVLYYTHTHKDNVKVISKEPKEITAEELSKLQNSGHFYGKFKTDFKYDGVGIDLSDDEIKLMLAVICDGTFNHNRLDNNYCYINLKKDRKKTELCDILEACGIKYIEYDVADGYTRFNFKAPRREKEFTPYWYNCSNRQLQLICDNILHWDGYEKGEHREFSTVDKKTADFVQFAFSACGYRSYISTLDRRGEVKASKDGKAYERKSIEYTVTISDQTYVGMAWHKDGRDNDTMLTEVKPDDGYKYCFTVPTHALVLRRNNKIFVTGNCGKTVMLNWFLEKAYEDSADILVIQENEELFAYSKETPQYRKGVKFQHVVNYSTNGEEPVSLEQLGQLALVAGANVFIIGEAKGAEICSAITLSNSGCRTAITIHSPSSTETIDKMADLAMRGYATDYDQAKRMLKSFQTIVYLKDFKVQEITEITGYDEKKHDMTYRYIYRRDKEK